MKLKNVAKFFDRTRARDAYDTTKSFRCQLEPFDYYKLDGAVVKRRVMSTAPDIQIPARRVIDIDGQRYLVGDPAEDHWEGKKIRRRYVLQGADHVAEVRSIPDVLSGAPGALAFASVEFNKYGTDERDNSDFHPQYHIYFSESESVPENSIITASGRNYLVRNSHRTVSGLVDALSNEIGHTLVQTAELRSRTYVPTTDSYLETTPQTVACIVLRWQEHFRYLSAGSEDYQRGDLQVLAADSVSFRPSDVVSIAGVPWTVLSSIAEDGYTSLHVRRQ